MIRNNTKGHCTEPGQCDPGSPCALCPKRGGSQWEDIGCRRGDFKDPEIKLCSLPSALLSPVEPDIQRIETNISSLNFANENDSWFQEIHREIDSGVSLTNLPEEMEVRQQFFQHLESTRMFQRSKNPPPELMPLKQCALAIIWELLHCPSSCQFLHERGSRDDLVRLLPFAIAYQVDRQEVRTSSDCPRSCSSGV